MTPSQPSPTNLSDELKEKLAAMEHERWADWQKWVHDKCVEHSNGEGKWVCFPSEDFTHWQRLIETPYAELSDFEKDADRKEVGRYLPLITAAYAEAIRGCVPGKMLTDKPDNVYDEAYFYNKAIDTMLKNLKERGLIK